MEGGREGDIEKRRIYVPMKILDQHPSKQLVIFLMMKKEKRIE